MPYLHWGRQKSKEIFVFAFAWTPSQVLYSLLMTTTVAMVIQKNVPGPKIDRIFYDKILHNWNKSFSVHTGECQNFDVNFVNEGKTTK